MMCEAKVRFQWTQTRNSATTQQVWISQQKTIKNLKTIDTEHKEYNSKFPTDLTRKTNCTWGNILQRRYSYLGRKQTIQTQKYAQ